MPEELRAYLNKIGDMAAYKLAEALPDLTNLIEEDARRLGPPVGRCCIS